MNIFQSILEKLGLQKHTEAKPEMHVTAGAQVGTPKPAMHVTAGAQVGTPGKAVSSPGHVAEMPMVDVMSKLENLGRNHPGLDWKVSIADLLQLLGIDNSYEARRALAVELGCPSDMMTDSARMNVWLHKTVLQKIAQNGGNVPASLLD